MNDTDQQAFACALFWAQNPDAELCPNHPETVVTDLPDMPGSGTIPFASGKTTPHVCPVCSQKPESFYGKLVEDGREVPVCPNHGTFVDGIFVVDESAPRLIPSVAATGGSSVGR